MTTQNTSAAAPVKAGPPGSERALQALVAVLLGILAMSALDIVAMWLFQSNSQTVVAVIGAIDSPIAALVAAFFGIKVGADAGGRGLQVAENARIAAQQHSETVQKQNLALAAMLPPDTDSQVLQSLGIPAQTPPAQPEPTGP